MRRLEPRHVANHCVQTLGLDPQKHLITSAEAISAMLRRAAAFHCPCAASTLVRNVVDPMRGVVEDATAAKTIVEATLEQLIALGDLLEYHDFTNTECVVLYAAPHSFIARSNGAMYLLGISADQMLTLPPELESRIEAVGCTRVLRPLPGERLKDDLLHFGLIEMPYERWTKMPQSLTAAQLIAKCDNLLIAKPSVGEISGLLVLEPRSSVRFYRGRWTDPKGLTGRYVARRNQAYGSPLWCYVELQNGQAKALLDLPAVNSRWRGCDEAWHLQMAIDACQGRPQQFKVRQLAEQRYELLVYSPIPMWAERRWEMVGKRVNATESLMAFWFHDSEIEEECRFAQSTMWLYKHV